MVNNEALILGTRGSRLALAQTEMVIKTLSVHNVQASPRIIKTSGDWKPEDGEKRLSEAEGGKGLFVKEIEQALLDGTIHAGVHSMKDVPSFLPDGAALDHTLPRGNPRDIFISRSGDDLMALPSGSVVGTSSLRRQAMIKKVRPDLVVVPLRGNVPTRLDKVRQGLVDATILAAAGLERLDDQTISQGLFVIAMDPGIILPACGQGIVCIETRVHDTQTRAAFDQVNHIPTYLASVAERRILQILDGSCHTPIGAYAEWQGAELYVRSIVATPDGIQSYQGERRSVVTQVADAIRIAEDLGAEMRAHAPAGLLPECRTGTF